MRFIPRSISNLVQIMLLAGVAAGCSGATSGPEGSSEGEGGAGEEPGPPATGGSRSGGKGGRGEGGSGGMPVTPDGTGGTTPDTGGSGGAAPDASGSTPDASTGTTPDEGPGATEDASAVTADSNTPMTIPGSPPPSYDGEIPIYYGPAVGPIVKMDCPENPTEGWTEYQDTFHVEHPYTLATNKRFSITGGIYNFWVFPNDAPHSPNAKGRNPRTEARYGGTADMATGHNFQHGMRMIDMDMMVERNAVGSAVMQIHTTATGGGPIGIRIQSNSDVVNNGSLTVVKGASVPGGLIDRWFNYKASLNADTLEVKIYVNNCLKSTYKGDRGDGNFYFKHGVYFCKTSQNGCFSHYKNIHLYKK
jgi:hypothetical protein